MGKGNWSVGVVVDERATADQRDAIVGIASGAAGGPMAALSGLVGTMLGVESSPIEFTRDGVSWSVTASHLVRMSARGATGLDPAAAPLQLSNTGHPAANTFSLARAESSHVSALGIVVGRHQRAQQRAVRAVLLAERVSAGDQRITIHAARASSTSPVILAV